jgi:hypothetical protein
LSDDEQFVDQALRRMYRWMAACALAVTAGVWIWKGAWHAGGFAAGAALSILNFHWLKAAVDGLAAAAQQRPGGNRGVLAAKWLLRYALIIAAAYVILRSSVVSLGAFLAGLFVFVAGVLAEMIYELATGT